MITALLYLQFHSIRNRIVSRLKRLKQPKYLVGAVVGGLYFYFYFVRYLFFRHAHEPALGTTSPEVRAFYEALAALGLLVFVVFSWLIPRERAALAFTEAEVAFLFPAPIRRRGLIHFKLLRSQAAIVFTALLLTLVSNRFGGSAWIHAAALWLILSTVNLHLLGCSFARTMLLDRGITNWQRRLGILTLVAVAGVVVVVWARQTIPGTTFSQLDSFDKVREYGQRVLASGPLPYLLYPFRLVVRPYFASDAGAFLAALGPALLILLVHYGWVVRSNVAFEEASVEASRRLAEKVAAVRAGNWQAAGRKTRAKRAPFTLAPAGFQPIALVWKNLISAGQAFTARVWIALAAVALGASVGLRQSASGSGVLPAIGIFLGVLLAWTLFIGPQVLRQDFRQDLPLAELLKSFPMRGWQIALGEVLTPALILTAIQWFLVAVIFVFFNRGEEGIGPSLFFGIALGVAIVLPMLDLLLLLIPNAAVLLFPAWFQTGRAAQGIEATGQRLIFMIGQLLAFGVALLPAAAVFAVIFFLMKFAVGPAVAVPIASGATAVILAVEVGAGVLLLGRFFDRFDLSAELSN